MELEINKLEENVFTCKEAGACFWLMLGIPLYQSDDKTKL